jgi:two-component system, OmpR family, sensor histidine kinase SenX3
MDERIHAGRHVARAAEPEAGPPVRPHPGDVTTAYGPMMRLVAHELRAHVTVLAGYSELLDDDVVRDDPERCRVALASMRTHLDSLREMAAHLSEAVQIGAPERLAYQPGTVDLHRCALEALQFIRNTARSRKVSLQCDLGGLPEGPVRGDRFQLVTAMRNLLENACRYGPPGGHVKLSVACRGGQIEVLVHDQGEGLRVVGGDAFAPFRRGAASADRAPSGMGLGLSLVSQVAQAHGGVAVWGDSPGGGSVIGLRFPAQLAGDDEEGAPS